MITAVMPTTESRRGFWEGAIRCFLSQTYTNSELLIVEEAVEPAKDTFPDRVNYLCLPLSRKLTTGAKRNVANSYALGEIICHWDDDDWSHPERIATQHKLLTESKKMVTGFHDLFFYRMTDKTFWKYTYPNQPTLYGSGTTLMYYRTWWESHQFMDKWISEDAEFSATAAREGVMVSTPCNGLMVARAHDTNTFKSGFGRKPFLAANRETFPEEFLREAL